VDADVTEPIPSVADSTPGRVELIRSQLTPSRILAGISTTVAVVAVAALVTVTTQQADTAPLEDTVAASPSTPAPAAPTTPAPAQPIAARSLAPEVLMPASPSTAPTPAAAPPADLSGGLGDIFTAPARSAAPARQPAVPRPAPAASGPASATNPAWPALDLGQVNSQWQQAVAVANAQPAVNAVVGTVTGTTGWVGNGAMNILGELLVAWVNQNGQIPGQNPAVPPADGLAALLLGPTAAAGAGLPTVDWSMVPPPALPPIDWTKIPPPQLPPIDWTKIPPPQIPQFQDPFAQLPSITRAIGLPF